MNFADLTEEEQVLVLVDDWLSTTPEIFGDDESDENFDEDEEYMNFLFDGEDE